MMAMMQAPDLVELLINKKARGEAVGQEEIMKAMISHPEVAKPVLKMLMQTGQLDLGVPNKKEPPKKPPKGRRRR
jgi:hypothetical protein